MSSGRTSERSRPASGFQAETRRLGGLVERWLTHELNRSFDTSGDGAGRRQIRVLLGLLAFGVLAFCIHVLLRAQSWSGTGSGFELAALPTMAVVTVARILLIMGIGSSMALGIAANFLADVFEIRDVAVARKFIQGVASGSASEVLHLRDGKVIDADRNSPILIVGGPGRAVVDFDTAALFEKPDGTPHVVGPSRSSRADPDGLTLTGFERLREPVINLRDQYIGSLAGEPMSVVGRSLDGMPVSVADVRCVFSVRREPEDDGRVSPALPYPFRSRDIEDLIYKQPVPVLAAGSEPSGQPGEWTQTMQELIRRSLSEFMSQNRLADFLAGVGAQELEVSEFREDTILSRSLNVSTEPSATSPLGAASKSRFHPRTELSARFKKYSGEFSVLAQEKGLELHWIGVGTWKMPDATSGAAVDDKHLEAWQLNRENSQRAEPQALERLTEAASLDAKLRLIQETPILYHQKNQERYSDKDVLMESLLQGFWEQLGEALEALYKTETHPADLDAVEQAVIEVEGLLKIRQIGHILGGGTMSRVRPRSAPSAPLDTPPAPSSRAEAAQYQKLLSRVDGNYKVAEAMISNEAKRHAGLGREELITRIVQRLDRHGA